MKPKIGNKLPLETLRYRLKCFIEHDQRFKDMGLRKVWQRTEIWPFIKKNLDAILADTGKDGTGDYPACPYAAGLLVQHMDADVHIQELFLQSLKTKVPKYLNMRILSDRVKVNNEIIRLSKLDSSLACGCDALGNFPTIAVRDPLTFTQKSPIPSTVVEALDWEKFINNSCLVAAIKNTKAKTQPSFNNPKE